MTENRKKIAIIVIVVLAVLALLMSVVLRNPQQQETQDPIPSTDAGQETNQPNAIPTNNPMGDESPKVEMPKPSASITEPGSETESPEPSETVAPNVQNTRPGTTGNKPSGNGSKPERPTANPDPVSTDPGMEETQNPTTKSDPVKGTDYTVPTGLKGTAGNKLSTVSLGNSNLVWSNPNEILSANKSQYEAKFVETDTKNEKVVVVAVTVTKATPIKGVDYTVPVGLKGTVGNKLSTVSLGNSNLVWSNPDEILSVSKSRYIAKFVETDTKNEKVVVVTVKVTKMNPVKGKDYTVPTGLKGIAGKKLSTVSLGNSNLVWSNPNEVLSVSKTRYEAKFVGTDTKNEITVMVKVTVQTASGENGNHDNNGGGSVTNPPVIPSNPPTDPDDEDEGNISDKPQQGGNTDGSGTTNPGTSNPGNSNGGDDDEDEGNVSDKPQQGGNTDGSGTTNPGTSNSGNSNNGDDDEDEGNVSDKPQQGGNTDGSGTNNPGAGTGTGGVGD